MTNAKLMSKVLTEDELELPALGHAYGEWTLTVPPAETGAPVAGKAETVSLSVERSSVTSRRAFPSAISTLCAVRLSAFIVPPETTTWFADRFSPPEIVP